MGRQGEANVLCFLSTQTKPLTGMCQGRHMPPTWVSSAWLSPRGGDDLVFIHHLYVLVFLRLTAGGETEGPSASRPHPCHPSSLGQLRGVPDDAVFLLVTEVSVLGKKDGVVGHGGLTCGQDAPNQVTHHGKNAIVHQQVIHQQLKDKSRNEALPPPTFTQPRAMHPSAVPSPSFFEDPC